LSVPNSKPGSLDDYRTVEKIKNGVTVLEASEKYREELLTAELKISVPLTTKVWRYMKLEFAERTLSDMELYIPRVDQLRDPWEGAFRVQADVEVPSTNDSLLEMPFRQSFMQRTFFVSCWHMSDFESDMMWKTYLGENDGVAFFTTIEKLLTIHRVPYEVEGCEVIPVLTAGDVRYIDHVTVHSLDPKEELSLLFKDFAYQGDREFRMIIKFWCHLSRQWDHAGVPEFYKARFDSNFFDGVVLKPGSSDTVAKRINAGIQASNLEMNFHKSRLELSADW
jgi:hypothetical protein